MRATLLFLGILLFTILHSHAQIPANNDCTNAAIISVTTSGITTVNFNNGMATQSLLSSCDTAATTYPDVWFEFTMPVTGNIRITGVNFADGFSLYNTCGGSEIDCLYDAGFFYNLTAGTYKLRAMSTLAQAGSDSFQIQAFETVTNDECANAIVITDDITTLRSVSYDNRGATESLDASCDIASNNYLDIWYEFTMPVNGNLRITGVNIFDRFTLYDTCGGSEIICSADTTFAYNLTIGTYLLRVSKQDIYGSADSFNIQAFASVANDECANAIVITDDITTLRSISYDNRGATESLDASCDIASNTYLDIWYEFTMPVNGNFRITGVNIFDRFTLYDTCGGSEIICSADTTFVYNLTAGTYLLRVSKQDIYGSADSFNIQAFPSVANDECATAEVITDDISTERNIIYDSRGATESLDASCDIASNTYLDIWYEFTMPVNGNFRISGVNIFDRFTLYDGCSGIEISCAAGETYIYNLTTGTYLLRVSKQDIYASVDNFSIQAFATVANDECATAEVITDDITTQRTINFDNRNATESLDASCDVVSDTYLDVWYEFTMPVNGNLQITGVNIFDRFTLYDTCGGSELFCGAGSFFSYDLSIGTYYLRVYSQSIYASADSFEIQAFATAANDDCATAEVITDDISTQRIITYDSRNATESLDASCDNVNDTHLDVWFEFTMPFQGNVEISAVSFFDRFTFYDSCGGTEIACFNNNGLAFGLSPGNYFVRVSNLSIYAAANDFRIQAYEVLPNDDCANAEMISVAEIGTCSTQNVILDTRSASETFTPNIGSCFSTSQTWLDAWYTFEAPITGNISLTSSSFNNYFAVYESCGGTEVACFSQNGTIPVVFGNTYHIQVARTTISPGALAFCLEGSPAVATGTAGVCENIPTVEISTLQGNTNQWVPIMDTSSNIVAAINANGNDLGTITTTLFIENADTRDFSGQPYLRREVSISTQNTPSGSVNVRLYILGDEVDDLILADPNLITINDLEIMKVNGNTCTSGYVSGGDFINTIATSYLDDYYIQFNTNSFSVFYPTATNLDGTLSIPSNESNEFGITIAPTLTDGIVYINADTTLNNVAVNVLDIAGRNSYQATFETLHQTKQAIDLRGYEAGMYFLKISQNNTQFTKRIIVK